MNRMFLYLLLLSCFFSCKKDGPPEQIEQNKVTNTSSEKILICNEGNYQFGNASLSLIALSNNQVIEDVFKLNNKENLGDVCQSVSFINQKAYVVVNNSSKIEVCNPNDFKKFTTIQGFISPRYICPVTNGKAFVSDLLANKIFVINLFTNTIVNTIPLKGWGEQMDYAYGRVYLCNAKSSYVYVIDAAKDIITDSIPTFEQPFLIQQDALGRLWIGCSGDESKNKEPGLICYDPLSKSEIKRVALSKTQSPKRMAFNGTNDTLFLLAKDVFRLSINDNSISSTPLISSSGNNFYGLNVSPTTSEIFLTDAIDYVQKGKVLQYTSTGILKKTFNVGIIPGEIYFLN